MSLYVMNDFGNNNARVITFNILVFFINRLCEKIFTTFFDLVL